MEPNPNLSTTNDSEVNHQVLIKEIMKMRNLKVEEKEQILDILAEIMDSHCGSILAEEVPIDSQLKPLDPVSSGIVDKDGKKVFHISGNGHELDIRGYKAQLPSGTTVIRYRLTADDRDEPVSGINTKSHKFGHTKEQVIKKINVYLGSEAEKNISEFIQYDSSFYETQQG